MAGGKAIDNAANAFDGKFMDGFQQCRVLCVEAQGLLGRRLKDFLNGDDYAVELAESGSTGLARARHDPFDIIVLDGDLPGGAGPDIVRELISQAPDVSIIFVSGPPGSHNSRANAEAMRAGVVCCVAKNETADYLEEVCAAVEATKRMSNERRKSRAWEERQRAIDETISAGILVVNIDSGRIVTANKEARKILGNGVERLFGPDWDKVYYSPRDRERLLVLFSENELVKNHELRLKRPDGSGVWILISMVIMPTWGENFLLASFIDVTGLKEAELELALYKRRVSEELEAARQLQKSLLPTGVELEEIAKTFNVRITSRFYPSSELSGDFWAALPLSKGRIGLFIADLTGHGIEAAVNAFRLHSLTHPPPSYADDVGAFMSYLTRRLFELLPSGHFAAGFYAIFDPRDGSLEYAGAAFPPPVAVKTVGGKAEELKARGLPLGVRADTQYTVRNFHMDGALFCYSDALIETPDAQGVRISPHEVREWVSEAVSAGDDIVEAVWEAAVKRIGLDLPDDLTMVAIRRNAP